MFEHVVTCIPWVCCKIISVWARERQTMKECVWAHQRTAAGWINSLEPWREAHTHHYLLSYAHANTHNAFNVCPSTTTTHPLLHTQSSVKLLSGTPHGPSVSSLHHYSDGLNSSSVCVYVCMSCVRCMCLSCKKSKSVWLFGRIKMHQKYCEIKIEVRFSSWLKETQRVV